MLPCYLWSAILKRRLDEFALLASAGGVRRGDQPGDEQRMLDLLAELSSFVITHSPIGQPQPAISTASTATPGGQP